MVFGETQKHVTGACVHSHEFFRGEGLFMRWLIKFLNEGLVPEYIYIYMLKWRWRCIFLFFPSFLLNHLSIHDKMGESILECFFISIRVMFTFSGGGILSHAHLSRGKAIGERHILRGIRHFLWGNFVLFVLLYAWLLVVYGALSYV